MLDLLLAMVIAAAPAPPPGAEPVDFPTPAPGVCDKLFSQYDANKDGLLSYKEYADGCWGQLRFAMAPTFWVAAPTRTPIRRRRSTVCSISPLGLASTWIFTSTSTSIRHGGISKRSAGRPNGATIRAASRSATPPNCRRCRQTG